MLSNMLTLNEQENKLCNLVLATVITKSPTMKAAEMRGSHNKVLTACSDSCCHDQVEATVTGH